MIETTLVPFAYAVIGIAAVVSALAVAAIVVALRELTGPLPARPSVPCPSDCSSAGSRDLCLPGRPRPLVPSSSPSPATGGEGLVA